MDGRFFAMLMRMKYIGRWGLMRNTRTENLSEHALEVAILSHALVVLSNRRLGTELSAERAVMLSLYHDVSEIVTGDLPTPIKYYNRELNAAYKEVELAATDKLLSLLPDDLREDYRPLLVPADEDPAVLRIVKAADKLSALIKCIEEQRAGNTEFTSAAVSLRAAILSMDCPAATLFLHEMLHSFELTLDELS